ncbi:MAG: hypothetical protein R3185_03090 [Candidatus Thermoplasmatota archaeon]|nr:hypothetical protein [Candidatus Thermoplasmatota archaeon]
MDAQRAEHILWWGAALCFLALAVLLIGEFTGWWNDRGEVAITIVSIAGVLLAAIALLLNATRGQAAAIREGVETNAHLLTRSNGKLDSVNGKLDQLTEENRRQTSVLVEIRDRL